MLEPVPFILKRLALSDTGRATVIFRTSFDEELPWLASLHTPNEDRSFLRNHGFPGSAFRGRSRLPCHGKHHSFSCGLDRPALGAAKSLEEV